MNENTAHSDRNCPPDCQPESDEQKKKNKRDEEAKRAAAQQKMKDDDRRRESADREAERAEWQHA